MVPGPTRSRTESQSAVRLPVHLPVDWGLFLSSSPCVGRQRVRQAGCAETFQGERDPRRYARTLAQPAQARSRQAQGLT